MVIAENERTNSPEMLQQTTLTMTAKSPTKTKGLNKIASGIMNAGSWCKPSTRRESSTPVVHTTTQVKMSKKRSKTNYYRIPAPYAQDVRAEQRALQNRSAVPI